MTPALILGYLGLGVLFFWRMVLPRMSGELPETLDPDLKAEILRARKGTGIGGRSGPFAFAAWLPGVVVGVVLWPLGLVIMLAKSVGDARKMKTIRDRLIHGRYM